METIRESTPKARKDYVCDFCLGVIQKGTKYISQTSVRDGDIETFRCHEECNRIANKLDMFQESPEGVVDKECFEEFIFEAFNEEFPNDEKDYSIFEMVNKLNETLK